MRIKTLKIKNLGKHKLLEAKLDGSVVGLMGVNGAGKSTILKIIHYLLTNWTPPKETQESFIRKVDAEIEAEPNQGVAEMEFYAQGSLYRITKIIGSGASRKLSRLDEKGKAIKEETYTRADEVQRILTDVLGADKYAIDSAVFPEQGGLDKILFGSQAEREELLVRLLLLGHMQKVADTAAGKIKILSAEIQDFSALHDELQANRNAIELELGAAEHKLTRTQSFSKEIDLFDKWQSLSDQIASTAAQVRTCFNISRENKDKLEAVLNEQSQLIGVPLSSIEDLNNWLNKLKSKISNSRQLLNIISRTKNEYIEYTNIVARLEEIERDLQEAVDSMRNIPVQDSTEVDALNKRITIQNNISTYRIKRDEAIAKHKDLLDKVVSLSERKKKLEEELPSLDAQINAISADIPLYKTVVDTCKLAIGNSCGADCPVCGEQLVAEKLHSRLSEYSEKLIKAERELDALGIKKRDIQFVFGTLVTTFTSYEVQISNLERDIEAADLYLASNAEEDVESLKSRQREIDSKIAEYKELTKRVEKIESDKRKANELLNKFSQEKIEALANTNLTDLESSHKDLDDKIKHWETKYYELSETLRKASSYAALHEAEEIRRGNLNTALNELTDSRDSVFNAFPLMLKHMVEQEANVRDKLTELNAAHTTLTGAVSQLRKTADAARKRLLEIEEKIKLDEDKRSVIAELQRVVTAFSRQGIPMAYVQHKFDNLVNMTQENLELMDANFAIIPHPVKPVSLQFYRVDEPSVVLFDQDKLSGGQKVRLSIAFLLAVQQLVIPDLGFLVLDEPSTHLDEESRENLKELLLNLSQQLENTDTQILVCDHARELEPAFVNVIQL